jgi:hypothetical protein
MTDSGFDYDESLERLRFIVPKVNRKTHRTFRRVLILCVELGIHRESVKNMDRTSKKQKEGRDFTLNPLILKKILVGLP